MALPRAAAHAPQPEPGLFELDAAHDSLGLLERQPAAVGVDGEELELDADRGALVHVRGGGQIVFPAMLDRVGERE